MATWAEFAKAAPHMAERGLGQIGGAQIGYLATTAKDGAPRVHPVCPFISEGRLFVATGPTSPKRLDLVRDGRYALHLLPGNDDAEFLIRGRARRIIDAATRQLGLAGKGEVNIAEDEWLFELDIDRVDTTVWENVGQPNTRPIRNRWP